MTGPVGTFRAYGPPFNFREETLRRIAQASKICEEYEAKGRPLTLRGLFYQHVARKLIDNNDREYDRLKSIVGDGRLAGLISWTAIEDLGRNLKGFHTWETPGQCLVDATRNYKRDKWADQSFYPEVWVEKQAMEGVVGHICNELEVNFFSCKGYNSLSEQYAAGRRFVHALSKGQRPIVFHLGDHDPSGFDMTRDNRERLEMFAGVPVQVVRIALNTDQVERYNPPPNPTKQSDSRSGPYMEEHGDSCWELDALPPDVIHELIRDAVVRIRDDAVWESSLERENSERQMMMDVIEQSGIAGGGQDGEAEAED